MISKDERFDTVNEQIRLIQKKSGLTFGTDAYLLAAYMRSTPSERGVDLGSGTGIIPMLAVTKGKAAHFHAVEIQNSFADIIKRNTELNGLSDRITPICADVRNLNPADFGGEVGLVTANPPYMPMGSGMRNSTEEKYLARHEVAGSIYDFCAAAGRLLKYGGRFYCVFRPERLGDLFSALRDAKLEPKRLTQVQATHSSRPSMVLVEAQKGASPSMLMTPPLCLYKGEKTEGQGNVPSEDSDFIYSSCAFPDKFTLSNKSK